MGAIAAAAPLITGIAGLAGVGLSAYGMSQMMKNNNSASQLSSLATANNQQAIDTLPETPQAPTNNPADAATNEAEAARQKQMAAMSANNATVNPTGGLGVTTQASTKKKTLGGGY